MNTNNTSKLTRQQEKIRMFHQRYGRMGRMAMTIKVGIGKTNNTK